MTDDPVDKAISLLNAALALDPKAMTDLVNMRVKCNKDLASHPTIQSGQYQDVYRVGFLGLMNGALSDSPSGVIGAEGPIDETTGHFNKIKRFIDLRRERLDVLT